jgi:hypothetical protein
VTARASALVTAAVCLALIVPRLLRLIHPQIWIEDESYLTGALMLSHGFLPYRDFPLPHYPLLEAMLASIFRVTHASIRSAEVTTQIAALAGSLLVFVLGRRIDGLLTGSAAAAIFATSGLLFRYHIFEREVFIVIPVLAAVLLASRQAQALAPARRSDLRRSASQPANKYDIQRRNRRAHGEFWNLLLCGFRGFGVERRRFTRSSAERDSGSPQRSAKASAERDCVAIGVLLFIALMIKLTAVAALAAITVQLWRQRGRRAAAQALVTTLVLLVASTIALVAAFGSSFVVQVFLFRAMHAEFPSLMVKLTEMRLTMDVSLACGAAGAALILWTRRAAAWTGPLLQLAAGIVVLVLLNPTYWAHTGIELLPWLSLCGGFLVASVVRALRRQPRTEGRVPSAKAYACAVAAAMLLVIAAPVRNLNWEAGDGSTNGFGYRDRREIARVAADVRDHTDAQALVATPPIIAFAADRRELVPYPEIAGTVDELTEAVRRRGYLAALRDPDLHGGTFWDAVDASRERIAPQIAAAIRDRRLGAVINDSPDDLMPVPFVRVPQDALEASGYRLESASAHYDVWLRR